jgi:general secretion pathway protein F
MAVYCYAALPKRGQRKRGVVDADSAAEAKDKLRAQGILVTELWVKRTGRRREVLTGQNRVAFTTQLAQLIAGGMPIFESLVALQEQNQGERYHPILVRLCDQIREGASLSTAMGKFPEAFDPLYVAMVSAGEASGSLAAVLQRLATLQSRQLQLRKQLLGALTYPAVIAVFCLLVTYLMLTFTVPSIAALFGDRPANGFTAAVLATSAFLSTYWWCYLPAIMGSGLTAVSFFRSTRGRSVWKRLLIQLPLVGSIAVRAALGRFCRTLATLQEGGLNLIDSLRLARAVMLNPWLEQKMQEVELRVVEGSSLSSQFGRQPHIPRLMSRMVAVGENSGALASMLEQVAILYESDVDRFLNRVTTYIQPALLLVMGVIVGLIMLAVLLPLTDISAMF